MDRLALVICYLFTIVWLFATQLCLAQDHPSASIKQTGDYGWKAKDQFDQFHLYSTVDLERLRSSLVFLRDLPKQIEETLQIKLSSKPIHVIVLDNQESLNRYSSQIVREAPVRRALYIRHRGPGLVLTFEHDDWIRDVRHECTHALLDASGLTLPLWQDEGLAEYFETIGDSPLQHTVHLRAVRSEVRYGQVAELQGLEQIPSSRELDSKEYREAWSTIAMLLHSSEASRKMYQAYLRDVQSKQASGLISYRWSQATKVSWRDSFLQFYR